MMVRTVVILLCAVCYGQVEPVTLDALEIRLQGGPITVSPTERCEIVVAVTNTTPETITLYIENPVLDWGLAVKRKDGRKMTDSKRVMHLYDANPEEIGSFSTSRIILKPGEERRIRVGLGAHFDVNEPGEYVLYLTNPRFKLPIAAPSKKEIPIVRTKRTVSIICVQPEKQK